MNLFSLNPEEIHLTEIFLANKDSLISKKGLSKCRDEVENLFKFAKYILDEGQAGHSYSKKETEIKQLKAKITDKEMTSKGFENKIKGIELRKASFSKIKGLFEKFKNFVISLSNSVG